VNWVADQQRANPSISMVANMSVKYTPDQALDAAVQGALDAGVVVVAGAGNETTDACNASPQRVPGVLTVGALDRADGLLRESNFGPCVDLYAPGQLIHTTARGDSTATVSGTSLSAPHVAGWAAMYLQANPTALPPTVHAAAIAYATTGRIAGLPANSYNRILFTWFQPYVVMNKLDPVPGSGGAPSSLRLTGYAYNGTGNVQPEYRDLTVNGAWTAGPTSVPPATDGTWTATVPANLCHDYDVRARYSALTSNVKPWRGLNSGFCNETGRVIWIQPAWLAGPPWTPGSLAVAGEASGAPAGTTVKMWWRNLTTGGPWTKVPYEPTTISNNVWLNEIPNANPLQRYEVYVVYDVFTSASCTYPGNNNITWC
jgi:hypothetical protein